MSINCLVEWAYSGTCCISIYKLVMTSKFCIKDRFLTRLIVKFPAAIPSNKKKVIKANLEKWLICDDSVIVWIFDLNVLNFDVAMWLDMTLEFAVVIENSE